MQTFILDSFNYTPHVILVIKMTVNLNFTTVLKYCEYCSNFWVRKR